MLQYFKKTFFIFYLFGREIFSHRGCYIVGNAVTNTYVPNQQNWETASYKCEELRTILVEQKYFPKEFLLILYKIYDNYGNKTKYRLRRVSTIINKSIYCWYDMIWCGVVWFDEIWWITSIVCKQRKDVMFHN